MDGNDGPDDSHEAERAEGRSAERSDITDVVISDTESDTSSGIKALTVFSSTGFCARVNPSRIFPRYDASLLLSEKKRKKLFKLLLSYFPSLFYTDCTED